MTTVFPKTVVCSVCGAENEIMEVGSTNAFGAVDLDTRPPEMKRSTMCYWVQECASCGYVAVDLTDETTLDRSFFGYDSYKTCKGLQFGSDLARMFYQYYMIMMAEDETEAAFGAVHHAAWACDDVGDEANAVRMREKAIELADRLLRSDDYDRKDTVKLIRADLLRRNGWFEEVLEDYGQVSFGEELLDQIIDFERELARRGCRGCYTVEDAEKYAEGRFVWP